jgi:hypothetical protein
MTRRTRNGLIRMTTGVVPVGTRPVASLHWRSIVEGMEETTVTCAMSSAAEMHTAKLKTGAETEQRDERDYDYYGPYYDQPHMQHSPDEGDVPGGVKTYSQDLKRVRWPLNFKTSGIEKYDGSTNPSEWLEVYQLSIEAAGGDSYIMVNYLPICLSASARTWHLGLLVGSVRSLNHLRQLFTRNFRATCAHLELTGT